MILYHIKTITSAALFTALAACVTSEDPGDGGFFNGVAGTTNGTYDARVAERETKVKTAEAENARLTAQLAGLRGEHSSAKNALIQARARARAAGATLTPTQENQVAAALRSNPNRVESLSKAIADARRLTDSIARLSS